MAPSATSPSLIPNPNDDICPVCKTTRYLNQALQLLVNPECYHPMCTTCVGRIFADGPAQCPYAGCHRTLRRQRFRKPYFADLAVEREVDIRKRVAGVFNKTEDDFETLADYNEYLDQVETLTMNLVYGAEPDRAKAERELTEWEVIHRAEIERRKKQGKEADALRRKREKAEEEAARQRRLEAAREADEERRQAHRLQEEMLNGLASADANPSAARVVVNKIMLKKRGGLRRTAAEEAAALLGVDGAPSLSIRGLRDKKTARRAAVQDEGPYDPFGGVSLEGTRYRIEDDGETYRSRWLDDARKLPDLKVGGYSADEYLSRIMFEAFSGLGVFVGEEKDAGETTADVDV